MSSGGLILIGEFWPNDPSEHFRGINLVHKDPARWRQGLRPISDEVFLLTVNDGVLWLDLRE